VLLDRVQPFVIVGTALLGLAFADLGALFQGHALLRYGVSTQTLVHLGLSAGLASAVLVVLAALFLRKPRLERWARGVAPFILGLGVVGGLLATWSGTTTGDWEYYLYLMHGSNFVLGAFTLRCFPSRRSV